MRRCASFSMKTKTVTPSSNTTNRHPCSDNSMMTLLLRSRAGSTTRWKARYGELWNSPPFDAPSDRRPSGATPHRNGPPEQERTRRHDGSQWLRTQTALIGLEDWRRAVLRCPRQRCDHSSENQIGRLIGAIACQVVKRGGGQRAYLRPQFRMAPTIGPRSRPFSVNTYSARGGLIE